MAACIFLPKQTVRLGIVALAALSLDIGSSRADAALVTYLFTDYSSASESKASDSGSAAPYVNAGNIVDNVVTGETTNSGFSSSTDMFFSRSPGLDATQAAALLSSDPEYLSFSLAPTLGNTLTISQISLKFGMTSAATNYTVNGVLRSSRDNYTADLQTYSRTQAAITSTFVYDVYNTTLGAGFSNLSDSTEFRIYLWDSSVNTNDILRIDEITVSGVPEPSAALFGAASLIGLLARRRRG